MSVCPTLLRTKKSQGASMEDEAVQHVEIKTWPRAAHEHEQSSFLPNKVSLIYLVVWQRLIP
jgi:hypothetical protein